MRDGLKSGKIGQSAAKLLSRKSGEGSTTRIYRLRLKAMAMKSVGGESVRNFPFRSARPLTGQAEGEDIV